MTLIQLAIRSLWHYRRIHLTVALAVAAATAVLTGALLVGDSMRGSLRALALDRLDRVDELLLARGSFREALVEELRDTAAFRDHYSVAAPAIIFPSASVEVAGEAGGRSRLATSVLLVATDDEFWRLDTNDLTGGIAPSGNRVFVNRVLADQLGLTPGGSRVTIGVPREVGIPADSALGHKDRSVERLVGLEVAAVLPDRGLGRFSLSPSQRGQPLVYAPLALVQPILETAVANDSTADDSARRINAVVLAGRSTTNPPDEAAERALRDDLRPQWIDMGLRLARATLRDPDDAEHVVYDYYSLSSDRLVMDEPTAAAIRAAVPTGQPVFVYLANELQRASDPVADGGIPYSIVAGIDFGSTFAPVSAVTGRPAAPLGDGEIAIIKWAADDLQVSVGDRVRLTYFLPQSDYGRNVEQHVELRVADILAWSEDRSLVVHDPHLTPFVPGLTDARSIDRWDVPFPIDRRIRPADDEFWAAHGTTPKAYVSLAMARQLWSSRFGDTTSLRIPVTTGDEPGLLDTVISQSRNTDQPIGWQLVPLKRQALAAAAGTTPFDALFLALSLVVIVAALVLISLVFRLGAEQRVRELGTLAALGFRRRRMAALWFVEMIGVSAIGACGGVLLGIGYAALLLWGLQTLWVGAIATPFLSLHVSPVSLIGGGLLGFAAALATMARPVVRAPVRAVRAMLGGWWTSPVDPRADRRCERARRIQIIGSAILVVAAVGVAIAGARSAGQTQAGCFLTSGMAMLGAALWYAWRQLRWPPASRSAGRFNRPLLAWLQARRNPTRSLLTIALVAVASFLIVGLSSFQLAPDRRGTAGFAYVARTSHPVLHDLDSAEGQRSLLGTTLADEVRVLALRVHQGDDASCNNLYRSARPQVLGISDQFIAYFDEHPDGFAWAGSAAESPDDKGNPWRLLATNPPSESSRREAIPAVLDRNTAWYSLQVYAVGDEFTADFGATGPVTFRVVGFLDNTILQGSVLVGERDFERLFPDESGYRMFLVGAPTSSRDGRSAPRKAGQPSSDEPVAAAIELLSQRLGDQGFVAEPATEVLGRFLAVQNNYIRAFQSLGGLGLLLGTLGLAAVQLRSVAERRKELAVMRALGFRRSWLAGLVMWESAVVLLIGLAIGSLAAVAATVPHYWLGDARPPWLALVVLLGAVSAVGLAAAFLASRAVLRARLIEALKSAR